jgi:hypothetical protein
VARLEALVTRLERLAKASKPPLRETEAALREARAADLSHVPPRIAERIRHARGALFGRAQELREAEEWTRWANASIQEELCQRLEGLAARDDHERVAQELRECDQRWAEARHAPKDQAGPLRDRYQAARALVRGRLDAYFAKKAEVEAESLRLLEALAGRAEALAESTDWMKAAEELKALQARWKQAGPLPRHRSEPLWKRFRAACDGFFRRREEDLKRRKEEWSSNLKRKQELIARAEALAASTDWEAAAAEIRRLQAEWKATGPVKRSKSEELWQRFRAACDAFFERYKRRDEIALADQLAARERVLAELQSLALEPEAGAELVERVLSAQARWRQMPPLPPREEEALGQRFSEARNRAIAAHPEPFRGTELDPEASRARREKICARLEALLGEAEAERGQDLSGEALARRLQEAMASNTFNRGEGGEAKRKAALDELDHARAAWRRLLPVPGEAGAALEERFQAAASRLAEAHRRARSGSAQAAATR